MKRLGTVLLLAALMGGAAGAERFGVQAGVTAGGGNLGLHAGAYGRVAGFGPVQTEVRGTLETSLRGQGGLWVGADALLSVNLLLLRPYAGVGVTVPLGSVSSTSLHTTLGARFGLPGPLDGFAEGNFGRQNVYRAGVLFRF
ncbi:hypothetical protein DEIPH_ctg002orf0014 [Deinococcus phoenicis]|uniref:Outer membrane protein beta-barrel domain-containing protein n=1 Tax=Deinococcus phoenicis TaxID=1476583 RepID=A0A016QUA3_9DEIO|nr:hypothetical protein [Deinococcus phoenicis]EYB69705.1 hypothetical protein DEIPH_ctg002orf0014 [Deinococcus phoenicis]